MDDPAKAALRLEKDADSFMTFVGIKKPLPTDRFVLVMGVTGSGKSTFVARCTGAQVDIGHDLYSCTGSISIHDYINPQNHCIHLIDTPGFDDTTRSEADTLELLATYLSASYQAGIHIDAVLVLQRITDVRMTRTAVRNAALIHAMCDLPSYARVAIVTTMWPGASDGSSPDESRLAARETSLRSDERYFGTPCGRGAALLRHAEHGSGPHEETLSARRIVARMLQRADAQAEPMVLRIQRELVVERKALDETLAGQVVYHDVLQMRREYQTHIRELKAQIDRGGSEELRAELRGLETQVVAAEERLKSLQASTMKEMFDREQRAVEERMEEMARKFGTLLEQMNRELSLLELSMDHVQRDLAKQQAALAKQQAALERDRQRDETRRLTARSSLASMPSEPLPPYSATQKSLPTTQQKAGGTTLADLDKRVRRLEQERRCNASMMKDLDEQRAKRDKFKQSCDKFTDTKSSVRAHVVNGLSAGLASGIFSATITAASAALCSVM